MNNLTRLMTIFVSVALLDVILFQNAHAYLDPGTGSFILQIAMAAIVGMLFSAKLFWGKIKIRLRSAFSKGKRHDETEN